MRKTELKVLNLSFNDIQEIPPTFFKSHTRLEELYLSGNKLSSLPSEELHSLTNLKVLFLNGNKLQTLPRELGSLKGLTVLDAGSNNLKYNINNLDYDWNWLVCGMVWIQRVLILIVPSLVGISIPNYDT